MYQSAIIWTSETDRGETKVLKGCGIDLVEISRIKSAWERFGRRFLERVFTPSEQAYCLARKRPEESLAARFAAKEAVAKALGGWD